MASGEIGGEGKEGAREAEKARWGGASRIFHSSVSIR